MIHDRHADLVSNFAGRRILVVGDLMLDRFVYGKIHRISPEAPVPVLLISRETNTAGGAGNVARNIATLGGNAILIGVVGDDEPGRTLCDILDAQGGVERRLLTVPGARTSLKIRYIAESQQVVRVDHETPLDMAPHADAFLAIFSEQVEKVEAVVMSDYAKGVLSDAVVRRLIAAAREAGKPVIVDPKSSDVARYDGATVITPNLSEAILATKISGTGNTEVAAMAEAILCAAPSIQTVIITRGPDGMSLVSRGSAPHHLPVTAREVSDVSGAGDTVVATLAMSVSAGASLVEAAELANSAAGIVVGKLGTAEVHVSELLSTLQHERLYPTMAKTASLPEARKQVELWRSQGLKVGFTNGCFDLVHPGHVSLLSQARSFCDRLIVGLNTDASIRRLKGPTRPMQDETSRAVVLGALSVVDLVLPFSEDTPLELISQLKPDVLVKGEDYTIDTVVGADIVQSYGGRIVLADLIQGQSTSGIISRMDKRTA